MKKKLGVYVLSMMALSFGLVGNKDLNGFKLINQDTVYADETEGKQYIKDINTAIENTLNAKKIDVDLQVGSTTDEGYAIRRNLHEDKDSKVIHMVDTVYDTVNGPQIYKEYWFDTEKEYRYKYDQTRKKYMFSTEENGDLEKEYLNFDYYLDPIPDDYINDGDTVFMSDNTTINVDGEDIQCKVLVKHKVYVSPKFNPEIGLSGYYIMSEVLDILNNNTSEDLVKLEIDRYYYIGVEDNKIYGIIQNLKQDGEDIYSNDISFSYPKTNLSIPKEYVTKAQLEEANFINYKSVNYISRYKGNKTILLAYFPANKKVKSKKKKIIIPKSIKLEDRKYKVIGIDESAFAGMKKLKEVVINADIESIDTKAFESCHKLKKIIIKSKKLKKIGKNALKGTSKKLIIKVRKSKKKAYKKLVKKAGNKRAKVK